MYLITKWISNNFLLHFALVSSRWDVWPLLKIQNSSSLKSTIPITIQKCTNAFNERYFWRRWNFTGHIILCTTCTWWQSTLLHGANTQKTTIQFFWRLQVRALSYNSNNSFNQQDATVSQVYYLTFMCGSTCFGRLPAHHQEHTTALGASGFTAGEKRLERCWLWSGRLYLLLSNSKTRGS
jgi:hypothetical protein